MVFHEDFSLKPHLNNVIKSCYYHIKDLRQIRKHIDLSVATQLAKALVSSRLDYCNSLFVAAPTKHLNKLQKVQNCLARVVTCSNKYVSSAPLLKRLHWLPVISWIAFKVNVITYKVLNTGQPVYLRELLTYRKYDINLRSNTSLGIALSNT